MTRNDFYKLAQRINIAWRGGSEMQEAYTIFKTVTHGAPSEYFVDYAEMIAEDVERYGHLEALRIWKEAQA